MATPRSNILAKYKTIERSIRFNFLTSALSFALKIAGTSIANSVTLFSDLLRSGADTFANLLSWLTMRRIATGKALAYDYGYGKLENLSSLLVAGTMLVSLVIALYGAVVRFREPVIIRNVGLGFFVALYSTGVNAWSWRRTFLLAKRENSSILESQWHNQRTKTVANLCVVLSLGLSLALQQHHWAEYIDPVFSLVLSGFLAYSIYSIVSMNVSDLLDRALDESLQLVILRELAAYFEDYVAFHGMRSRRSGKAVYVDLFLEFDGTKTMAEVQKVIDAMRAGLEQKIPGSHVVISPATARVV
jgi:cation diffusion facilitator family transporter